MEAEESVVPSDADAAMTESNMLSNFSLHPDAVSSVNDVNASLASSSQLEFELMIYYKTLIPSWILCCLGTFVLNTVIAVSGCWVPRPASPTVSLSLSLAAADAYTSLVLCASLVYDSLLQQVLGMDFGHYQTCFSLIIEVCRFGGLVVTALHLLALSINHLFGATYPLKYPRNVRQKVFATVVILLWILPNAFFAIYFAAVPGQGFQSTGCLDLRFFVKVRFRLLVALLIFTPLVAMAAIYAQIFVTIQRSRRALAVNRCETMDQARRRNNKAMVTTLLILGTYTIGWIPAVVQLVIICDGCLVGIRDISRETVIMLVSFTNSLLIAKAFVDPIVYAVRIPEVRGAVQTMWRKCLSCRQDPMSSSATRTRGTSVMLSRRNGAFVPIVHQQNPDHQQQQQQDRCQLPEDRL